MSRPSSPALSRLLLTLSLCGACASKSGAESTNPSTPRAVGDTSATAGTDHATAPAPPSQHRCDQYPDRDKYWIRVTGDGDAQDFREGWPISDSGYRSCGPGGALHDGRLSAAGCAERTATKRSCLFVSGDRVGYFDRAGLQHDLTATDVKLQPTATGVDGTLRTAETLPGRSAPLLLEFHLTRCPWQEGGMQDDSDCQ